MRKLCVIGDPVGHSLSPVMHNAALKALNLDFEYISLKPESLKQVVEMVRKGDLEGVSVTMPYKESIVPFLDMLTPQADFIKTVNTIYKKGERVVGHNTDGEGCIKALKEHNVNIRGKRVVLLGAGGAAKAIAFSLSKEVDRILILNRTPSKAMSLALLIKGSWGGLDQLEEALKDADILINATPVGMKGVEEGKTLVTSELIPPYLTVQDIVYSPRITKLLKEAQKAGAKIIDGLSMLLHQGAEQFEIFTGKKAPMEVMRNSILEVID
jgi:shikimate dehydrogenase